MLRSFRSHKGLRSSHSSGKVQHARHPSDASMDSRSSTTSSTMNGRMVDFDPLRCHPVDLTFAHRPSLGSISEDELDGHRPVRPSRSMPMSGPHHHSQHNAHYTTAPRVLHHHHQPTTPTGTVIYDGFDFGFDQNKPTPSSASAPAHHHHSAGVETPSSPTPSTDSFSSSFSSASSDSMESHYCAGLAAAPQPRQRVVQPKEVSTAMARPRAAAGLDAADDFIKRGGWKRRGVIFELDVPMADEEECFDLDMD